MRILASGIIKTLTVLIISHARWHKIAVWWWGGAEGGAECITLAGVDLTVTINDIEFHIIDDVFAVSV